MSFSGTVKEELARQKLGAQTLPDCGDHSHHQYVRRDLVYRKMTGFY